MTLAYLPNVFGILSGLLLICAGALLLVWRNEGATERENRERGPQRGRDRSKRPAGTRYPPNGGADQAGDAIPPPEHGEFTTTRLTPGGGTPGKAVLKDAHNVDDGATVTGALLSLFSPFNELDEALKESLARGLVVSRKPAGTVLIKRGSKRDVSIYLIDGTLTLKAADGKKTRVVGGTPEAFRPLCQLSPHIYSAVAHTDVAVIILSQTLLRDVTTVVTEHKNMPGIEVSHLVKI